MTKLPISVCIVSGAEAHRIGKALESVAGWVSEIVVVLDERTQDETEALATRYGAAVHRHVWQGFREQKNLALGYASQPWTLSLDADEEVSHSLAAEIARFFTGDHEAFAGASFPRKVWFLGRWITHGDWYPDRVLRLFRSDSGRWSGSTEHCLVELKGREKQLRSDLLHYTNPTINSYIDKINFYSDIFLQRQIESGKRWSAMETVIRGAWRFQRAYVFRMGFMDGFPGLFIATTTAYGAFVRHSRLYEHQRSPSPPCNPDRSR